MTTVPLKRQHAPFLGSIRVRLLGIIVLFGLALIAIVAALSWFAARDIYAGRQDELRTVVEVASKAVQQQYDEFKKGTISEAEAQQRAKASSARDALQLQRLYLCFGQRSCHNYSRHAARS